MATSIIKAQSIDYIVDQGTSGNWKYRKWNSGRVEAWGYKNFSSIPVTSVSPTYGGYRSAALEIAIPSGIFGGTPEQAFITKVNAQGAAIYCAEPKSATLIQFYLGGSTSSTTLENQRFNVYCVYGG